MQGLMCHFISMSGKIFTSPDPYLEIILEVNLNFQVRLTIILANGILFPEEFTGKFAVVIYWQYPFSVTNIC